MAGYDLAIRPGHDEREGSRKLLRMIRLACAWWRANKHHCCARWTFNNPRNPYSGSNVSLRSNETARVGHALTGGGRTLEFPHLRVHASTRTLGAAKYSSCSDYTPEAKFVNETSSLAGDLDLMRRTALVLHLRGICGADQVVIAAEGGTVILCGELESPHAKWQCLECCRHVAGVMRIVDQIHLSEVVPDSPAKDSGRPASPKAGSSSQQRRRSSHRRSSHRRSSHRRARRRESM